jgi:hypothetical protein
MCVNLPDGPTGRHSPSTGGSHRLAVLGHDGIDPAVVAGGLLRESEPLCLLLAKREAATSVVRSDLGIELEHP